MIPKIDFHVIFQDPICPIKADLPTKGLSNSTTVNDNNKIPYLCVMTKSSSDWVP